MAKPGEKFAKDEWVTWDDTQPQNQSERKFFEADVAEYGRGPFRIVDVREVDDEAREHHTQCVTISVDEQRKTELPYSGRWLTHPPH